MIDVGRFLKYSIFLLVLLLANGFQIAWSNDETCWINEDVCKVRAELYQNFEFANGLAMQIDCLEKQSENLENDLLVVDVDEGGAQKQQQQPQQPSTASEFSTLWHRRFMGIQSVMLDGCQTPLNTPTYGLEFLPICANVTKVGLQNFHIDSLAPLQCAGQLDQLEYLVLQHNEIASIDDDSFGGHYPQLRVLELQGNSLKKIQNKSLQTLRALEHLKISKESVLMLKTPDLFESTAAISIYLVELKQMTSEIFRHLPETLQTLYVADTAIDNGGGGVAVKLINAHALGNLTIARCALEAFTLIDKHSSVAVINLQGNALKEFHAYENQLKELDLGGNSLDYFPHEWLKNLTALERLSLRSNRLHILSLFELMDRLPNGHYVDLRDNRLQTLQEVDKEFPSWQTLQMRLKADHNPWDCLWLHDFAHAYPEKFRLLQYDKFISRINVNGLECIPSENPPAPPIETKKHQTLEESPPTAAPQIPPMNVLYTAGPNGDQWEFKRNQRAEALIIVFMLPLGIAFLFLLLYMWIYCQKMFHLSYYKNFSCVRNQVPIASQRFDVVRQLPPLPSSELNGGIPTTVVNEPGGYEVPLHGMCSECNCKSLAYENQDKCHKTVHITYGDTSPQELPHQIYEEIINVSDNEQQK
ncbi:uncharacterized protein LOC101895537 [Musca domestica]|uniref:Leucine rich repeat protein n=1 Tax=Musca domestica TaxID=7370 RepID=T1PJM3_MUSDO|nr:uncharacterized protein LOC101895537 [Musca domestica]